MISHKFSLKQYNTFGIDNLADTFVSLSSEKEIVAFLKTQEATSNRLFVLGGGSNLLFLSDLNLTILHPMIKGISVEESTDKYEIISAGSGIGWDHLVEWSVNRGLGGLENLSLIPGTVGATPVQNIGAYGAEIKDVIYKVRAVSLSDGNIKEFSNEECRFGYRDSIFKNELKNKFLITRVSYRLSKMPSLNTSYGSVLAEVNKLGELSVRTVREAVINIRRNKLPDPEVTGNAGSFFRNPVIRKELADELNVKYPCIPHFTEKSGDVKISAGWLIEECGWKGKRFGDAGVHEKQALVLVNFGKATGHEIFELSEKIRISVIEKFGIDLQREVEILGDTERSLNP